MSKIKISESRTRRKEVSKRSWCGRVFVTRPGTGVVSRRSWSSQSKWPALNASSSTQSATPIVSRSSTKKGEATCRTCSARRYSFLAQCGCFVWRPSSSRTGNSKTTATKSTSVGCSLYRYSLSPQSCLAGSSSHFEWKPSIPTER